MRLIEFSDGGRSLLLSSFGGEGWGEGAPRVPPRASTGTRTFLSAATPDHSARVDQSGASPFSDSAADWNVRAPFGFRMRRRALTFGPVALTAFASLTLCASDWPQFLGPTRNGIYAGAAFAENWPKAGPPVIWQKKTGQGFSGPVVASGKLILFHRLGDKETVECLDARNGNSLWTFDYPTSYRDDFGFDEGPRATPAVSDGRVYTYGAEGVLHCLDLSTGKKIWAGNCKTEFNAEKGFFGIACSPLVEGNRVLLNVGGNPGAGVVAFNTQDGKVLWKVTDDEASYSSPTAASINDRRLICTLTRGRLLGLAPDSGKLLFQFPFRPPMHASVTAAMPLIIGDLVFLSASYGTGAALLKIDDSSAQKLWASDQSLSAHYATAVHHAGFLYGIHGRVDPGFEPSASLRCIELKTGKVKWEQTPFGAATIVLAGDDLLILNERGELIRAPASPAGFKPTARAQILPTQVRAHPALADGLFYARSKDKLVCLDLK